MIFADLLNVIQTVIAVLSLIISIFVATKVISIESKIRVKGDENITGGRDVNVTK